jgi:hypothetical protein
MIYICFTAIVIGVCISLCGWGALCHRLAKCPIRNWVVAIAIGLGAIIFLGGILNLLRCAYGWAFDGLLITGIALAVKFGKFKFPRDRSEWFYLTIPCLLIALIMYVTVTTQLTPKVFNWHDDFEKYFAHPVRMLETGTLSGSPLNALGSETLGGLAVLHGMVLNHFPIQYINGVDAVFGLLLCLLLSVSMFSLRAVYLPMFLISPLVVFFINPQYVNVSALYMGSAFMMTSILLFSGTGDYEDNEKAEKLPSPVLTGIVFAALIALKSVFVAFPLLYLIFSVIVLLIFGADFGRLIRWGLITTGMTLLFLLPWILLYIPNYVHSSFAQAPHRTDIIIAIEKQLSLLSTRSVYYGASIAHYTFIGMVPALPVIGIVLWKQRERTNLLAGLVAGVAAIIVIYISLLSSGRTVFGYNAALRYAVPFVIADAPIIFSLVYLRAFRDESFGFKVSFAITQLLLGVITIIIFSYTLTARIRQGYENGSVLAFSATATNPKYIEYSEKVIHGDTKSRIITAQKQIPAGQALVAWISTPFYLDYKRNIVYDAERSGIATPWAYMPEADYFLFEYKGLAVRTMNTYLHPDPGRREQYISEKCIVFLQFFQNLRWDAVELYNDGRIVVLKKRRTSS